MNKLLLTIPLLSAPTLAADQTIYLGGWINHIRGKCQNS